MEKIKTVPSKTIIKLLTMEYPPNRGGAGVYCEELAYATNELGGNIEVLAPKGASSNSSVNLSQLPFNGSQDWGCSWKIKKVLKSRILRKLSYTLPILVHYGQ